MLLIFWQFQEDGLFSSAQKLIWPTPFKDASFPQ